MEDPQDSFSSARHLLLEVMAEQEGCSLLDSKRGVQASHRHYGNEYDCRRSRTRFTSHSGGF